MLTKVLYNKKILPAYYKLGVRWHGLPSIEPGQFIMLRITGHNDPLLSRPFGVYKIMGKGAGAKIQGIEILYKVVGKGTKRMTDLRPGNLVDILGPLGNGFSLDASKKNVIMIAGGIGIVPFCILAMRCQAVSIRQRLLFGGRSEKDLPGLEDFKKQNIDIVVSTDDGSVGKKGVVTELLKKELSKRGNPVVYACGPNGMLKEIARMTKKSGVPCYVSLESVMACGIGACLGCAVKVKGQKNISDFGPPLADRISDLKSYIPYPTSQIYKMVCKDGPVFNAEEIVWEEL